MTDTDWRLLTEASGQDIVRAPVNTAAKVGSQAMFNCTTDKGTDPDEDVIWEYNQPGLKYAVRIYDSADGDIKTKYRDQFGIELDDMNGAHNLLIKDVQMNLAVTYVCGLKENGQKAAADLIALSTDSCFTVSLWNIGQHISYIIMLINF